MLEPVLSFFFKEEEEEQEKETISNLIKKLALPHHWQCRLFPKMLRVAGDCERDQLRLVLLIVMSTKVDFTFL